MFQDESPRSCTAGRALTFVVIASLAGCAKSAPISAEATLMTTKVKPSDTMMGVGIPAKYDDPHLAVVTSQSGSRIGKLLLLIPGTGNNPDIYESFAETMARLGYHTIVLEYVNSKDDANVGVVCDRGPTECASIMITDPQTCTERCRGNLDCNGDVRLENLEGGDKSPCVQIDATNSIKNRLSRLLEWLAAYRPSEGWERYGSGKDLRWADVVVAGHSLGTGMAAMIAKLHAVHRVCLIGGPVDFTRFYDTKGNVTKQEPSSWLSDPSATDGKRYFAFDSYYDKQTTWQEVRRSLVLLGMPDKNSDTFVDTADVQLAELPPAGTRAVLSQRDSTCDREHQEIIEDLDVAVPKDCSDKPPDYSPIWRFVCDGG